MLTYFVITVLSIWLATCYVEVEAQMIGAGGCPKNVQPMQNFDSQRYLGRWYEAKKSNFFIFEAGGKCVSADYSLNEKGNVKVVNKAYNTILSKPINIEGEAVFAEGPNVARLAVSFPTAPVNFAAPYWVVDTDYDSYAIVWSCLDLRFIHAINSWILTRERNPDPAVLQKVESVAQKNGFSTKSYTITDQSNC